MPLQSDGMFQNVIRDGIAILFIVALGRASASKVRHPYVFRLALESWGVLPSKHLPALAVGATMMEWSVVVALSLSLTGQTSAALGRVIARAVTSCMVGFVILKVALLRLKPAARCGCDSNLTPNTWRGVARTVVLAVASTGLWIGNP